MSGTSKSDIKLSLRHLFKKYQNSIAITIFLIGVILRLLATYNGGPLWQFVGDFGTFLAAAIAIPFIYERFLKAEDSRLFISDLEEVLDTKLATYGNHLKSPRIFELGRMPIHEKVDFFQNANIEVIEFGLSLSTLVGFFEQRPAHEYKKPVMELLQKGVRFRCFVLDPDSPITTIYAQDRKEDHLADSIRASIKKLLGLRDEFKGYGLKGAFEVKTYSHFPYCYVLLVDPQQADGRAYISHYMHATKRADTPILEIHKASNPILFEKYYKMVEELSTTSKDL